MQKKNLKKLTITLLLLALTTNIYAQENTETPPQGPKKIKGMHNKIDGVLYTGYEYLDPRENSRNPKDQDSGFTVTRAYLNFRGTAVDPAYAGWGYRITIDFSPAASLGAGCDPITGCAQSNDLDGYFKYAYFTAPAGKNGRNQFIIGQQSTPFGDLLQRIWGYRHVARSVLRQAKVAASADRGIGFKSDNPYFKTHLLLGNGEGYHYNNSDPGSSEPSQALDLYGNFIFVPTGANKQSQLYIHLPFRLYNIIGLRDREKDSGEINAGEDLGRLRGFGRGLEINYVYQKGNNELKVGVGNYFLNRPGGHKKDSTERVNEGVGRIGYLWVTFQIGIFGAFYSYYEATSNADSNDGRLVALEKNGANNGRAIRRIYGINFRPPLKIALFNISLGEDVTHLTEINIPSGLITGKANSNAFLRFGLTFSLYDSKKRK